MSAPQWETITVPAGAYVGWGTSEGQHVTGKVVEYSPTGGSDFNGDPCPHLVVELSESAASFNKEGERTDYPEGELVNLTVGQAGLKRAVQAASLETGDLVKITMTGLSKTTNGRNVKTFDLKKAKGAAGNSTVQPQPQQPQPAEAAPPF